jgi:hypothetical protein
MTDKEKGDSVCHDKDGCPTENAVLRREWRSLSARVAELEERCKLLKEDCDNCLEVNAALKAGQGEPVAEVVSYHQAGMYDELPIGTLLYASAPSIPDGGGT